MPPTTSNAHGPGQSCMTFAPDGLSMYTGGTDCLVRVWRMDPAGVGMEPNTATEADEPINSVTASSTTWLSASSDSSVRQYNAKQHEMTGLFTRTAGIAARAISFDPKGEKVAVASDETAVKVISFADSTEVTLLNGHTKGVRKVTWHPDGNILSSTSSDGTVIIWDTSTAEVIHTVEGIIPVVLDQESEEFAYDCSAVWHPTGKEFYIPSKSHDVVSIQADGWKKHETFTDAESSGSITALNISSNGSYLAVGTESNQVLVYSTITRKVVVRYTSDAIPVSMAFSPKDNLLAWTSIEGSVSRWKDVIPSELAGPNKKASSTTQASDARPPMNFDEMFGDGGGDGEAAEAGYDDEDWIIDDTDGALKDDAPPRGADTHTREMVSVVKAQPAFQPGATPMLGKRRYLTFNSLGVIEVTDQDTHNVVNVEFHDRSMRKGYHFQDTFKYDMASLGERGVLYACPPENDHPGRIEYKPYATWASTSEWSFSLPAGERAVAVAAGGTPPTRSLRRLEDEDIEGNGSAVVATSTGYVRFFSGGGLQRYVWFLGDDIVAMVAGREWVFVAHRDGGTSLDGCQNLKYSLMALDTFRVVQEGRLPLPRGRTLKWIGISEEGAPVIYDSTGVLSLLDRFRQPTQARWVPLIDTNTLARKEGKDESYWPIGVAEDKFMCLILKGREQYPGFPRPLVQELDIHMPLLELDRDECGVDEKFLRESLFTGALRDSLDSALTSDDVSRKELNLDKQLIRAIQAACKTSHLQRALDAVLLLHHTNTFDGAEKVAGFYHFVGLQEKIGRIKDDRKNHDWREDEREQRRSRHSHATPIAAPSRRRSSPAHTRSAFDQPPAGMRRPLQLATPIHHSSRSVEERDWGTENSFTDEPDLGKRKRMDDVVGETDPDSVKDDDHTPPKRRVVSSSEVLPQAAPIKPAVNPFAKKPLNGAPGPSSLIASRSLHKTNSFFDKVDAMDVDVSQKEKPKPRAGQAKPKPKEGSKQMTLFGFQPAATGDSKKQSSTSTTTDIERDSNDDSQEAQTETQLTEGTLVDSQFAQSQKIPLASAA